MLAAHFFDRHARLGLTQEANDLLLGIELLYVQTPCRWGVDSKSGRYSKMRGCQGSVTWWNPYATVVNGLDKFASCSSPSYDPFVGAVSNGRGHGDFD